MKENFYQTLVELTDAPTLLEFTAGKHLKFVDRNFPWSIVEKEFKLLYNTIVDNKLKRGFEACTGIGMSALAAAMAMQETGGLVVTIDAYIEETLNDTNYANHKKSVYTDSRGYKNINFLIEKFELKDFVVPVAGWSPDDVPAYIEKHFTEPLEYVFIDGGHFEHQVIKDIECLLPYTNDNTFWMFHDVNLPCWTPACDRYCREKLNRTMKILLPASEGCNNLGMLIKS